MNINEIVTNFNGVAIDFMNQLKNVCPHSIIANNIDAIESLMTMKGHERKIIDQFTYYVLKYKDKIDSYDESFFISCSFHNEANGSASITMLINELKEIWLKINKDDKKKIFDYLRVLCYYSQEYVLKIT